MYVLSIKLTLYTSTLLKQSPLHCVTQFPRSFRLREMWRISMPQLHSHAPFHNSVRCYRVSVAIFSVYLLTHNYQVWHLGDATIKTLKSILKYSIGTAITHVIVLYRLGSSVYNTSTLYACICFIYMCMLENDMLMAWCSYLSFDGRSI